MMTCFLLLISRDGVCVLFFEVLLKNEVMLPFGGSAFLDFFAGLLLMTMCCAKYYFVVNRWSKM